MKKVKFCQSIYFSKLSAVFLGTPKTPGTYPIQRVITKLLNFIILEGKLEYG